MNAEAKSRGEMAMITGLRALLPVDEELFLCSVDDTDRLLVVHEDATSGGDAGGISMRVNEGAFEWLDAPVQRFTAIDAPVPYSPVPGVVFSPGGAAS